MRVQVLRVSSPAMTTIGYGYGVDDEDRNVKFVGDHRPMRHLGEALEVADEAVFVDLDDWQILDVG